jgi:anti-sigma B factor antagonist
MMDLTRNEEGPVTVIRLAGEIDQESVNTLRVGLLNCLKDKRCNVVVDCSDVRYVSYMAVGVLLERRRQLMAGGGDLKLAALNLVVKRTLHMASVTGMFSIYDTIAQARDGFRAAA